MKWLFFWRKKQKPKNYEPMDQPFPEHSREVKHITAPQARELGEKRLKEIHKRKVNDIMFRIDNGIMEGQTFAHVESYLITDQIIRHFEGMGYVWDEVPTPVLEPQPNPYNDTFGVTSYAGQRTQYRMLRWSLS